MAMHEASSMVIPVDPDYYPRNMSFSSSPGSSPLSPVPSSPATLAQFPVSPQDTYLLDAPAMLGNIQYPEQTQQQPQLQQQEQQYQEENKNVSTFISKLFKMVNDKRYQNLISWSLSGLSFLIIDSRLFSIHVLPEYFKHGNFSSFVRQLNMYGFRKINKTARSKRGAQEDEVWEFSHPRFERDHPEGLCDIKRKVVESDVLRRETGDMQTCFNMMQASQNCLLEQFRVLQGNFSNLIQGFEDLKRNQNEIQAGIFRLAEFDQPRIDTNLLSTDLSGYTPPVLVTSPQPNPPLVQTNTFFNFPPVGSPLPTSPMSMGGMSTASSHLSMGNRSISNI
ncbi:HSF-type DNA-binding-domain-containing protein [Dichotomocladium elegans]|nr:HSF-type DNA-binding-domain-containing protein [Dichotomocladium elegans]